MPTPSPPGSLTATSCSASSTAERPARSTESTLRLAGSDPRVALRESVPDELQLREIERRLARLDRASRHGPWTQAVLRTIHDQPEVRAADLAPQFGRERLAFKLDVRKLKELGLTESLPRGYRLSPRGLATLEWLAGSAHRR